MINKACSALLPVFLMACISACQNRATVGELNKTKASESVEARNKEAVLKMYDRLSNGDSNDFLGSFWEDARIYGTDGFLNRGPQPNSPLGAWLYFDLNREASRMIEEVVADKDAVMVRLVTSGIDREGVLYRYRGVHTWHLKDRRIAEGWVLDDTLEWVIQMRKAKGLDKNNFPWFWGKSPNHE